MAKGHLSKLYLIELIAGMIDICPMKLVCIKNRYVEKSRFDKNINKQSRREIVHILACAGMYLGK